jgi:hypothetical protein
VAATEGWLARLRRWGGRLLSPAALAGGALAGAGGASSAADLPEDRAEAMFHLYDGGGTRASGPALLVRKSMADRVSLTASTYVDMVSNASIDVVTTASPYRERRVETGLAADVVVRDSLVTLAASRSREPDYAADTLSLDVAQETFGGMTTVNLGATRGWDKVGQHGTPGWIDTAQHWRWRLGLTQILTPRWLASANLEALADDGLLGSPYRVARVYGAAVPERDPRTRSSRSLQVRVVGDLGGAAERSSVRASYRYFWDTWDIRAHTVEAGYSRYFGSRWLADAYARVYNQRHALFYSDNAAVETAYVSRNRQLASFNSKALGARLSWSAGRLAARYDVRLNGSLERIRFDFHDFTDTRTGSPYAYDANLLQLYVSATF